MAADEQDELDHFTALNGDCIDELFKKLSIDDLCSASRTCIKLNQLAAGHFHRCFPERVSQPISIVNRTIKRSWYNTIIPCIRQNENYVRCFSRQIEHVKVRNRQYCLLIRFMQQNCSRNIMNINFGDRLWTKWFVLQIKPFLQNAETITFWFTSNRWFRSNPEIASLGGIIRHFPKMKHLHVYIDSPDAIEFELDETYEHLESFSLEYQGPSEFWRRQSTIDNWHINLSRFFSLNPNVKRFNFRYKNQNKMITLAKRILRLVAEHSQIEELTMSMYVQHAALFIDELKKLDKRESFKRLSLNVVQLVERNRGFPTLTTLQKLNRLCIGFVELDNRDLLTAQSFVNLKVLAIDEPDNLPETYAINWAQNLSNLEELYLDGMDAVVMRTFARHSKKLNKMIVTECRGVPNVTRNDILQLDGERQGLDGACQLNLLLDEQLEISSVALVERANGRCVVIKRASVKYSLNPKAYQDFFVFTVNEIPPNNCVYTKFLVSFNDFFD